MGQNVKQVVVVMLLAAGLGVMLYGFNFNVQPVYSEDNDKGFATAESVLLREVSIGGLERDAEGKLHRTYTGKAPQACPT